MCMQLAWPIHDHGDFGHVQSSMEQSNNQWLCCAPLCSILFHTVAATETTGHTWQPWTDHLVYMAAMVLPWAGKELVQSNPTEMGRVMDNIDAYLVGGDCGCAPVLIHGGLGIACCQARCLHTVHALPHVPQ